MATNYVQQGEVMPKTVAGTAITSGQVVVTSNLVGISLGDYAAGETAQIALEGVWQVDKAAEAFDQGDNVYWDANGNPAGTTAGTGAATGTSTDNTLMGHAFAAVASNAGMMLVKLLG